VSQDSALGSELWPERFGERPSEAALPREREVVELLKKLSAPIRCRRADEFGAQLFSQFVSHKVEPVSKPRVRHETSIGLGTAALGRALPIDFDLARAFSSVQWRLLPSPPATVFKSPESVYPRRHGSVKTSFSSF